MTPDFKLDAFSTAILRALAEAPSDGGMSLPRLGKRLGLGASVILRQLTRLGDAVLGGVQGPGWVRVVQVEDRWVAHLTEAGRAVVASLPPAAEDTPVG